MKMLLEDAKHAPDLCRQARQTPTAALAMARRMAAAVLFATHRWFVVLKRFGSSDGERQSHRVATLAARTAPAAALGHKLSSMRCLIKRSFDVTPGDLPRVGRFVYDSRLENTSLFSLTHKLIYRIESET
jgi:hypothetical protein